MAVINEPTPAPVSGRAPIDPDYPYGRAAPRPDLEPILSKSWLFEIVDSESGTIDSSFTLILPPTALTIKEPQRVTITKSFGNAFVDDYGPDNIQITLKAISGTSHVFPTFRTSGNSSDISDVSLLGNSAASASGGSEGYTGRDAFYEFRDSIMRYKDRDGWEKKELRVYDLADEQAYKCILLDFTLDRSAEIPVNRYPFTISLFVYQRLDQLTPDLKVINISKDPIMAFNQMDVVTDQLENTTREQPEIANSVAILKTQALELRSRYNQFLTQVTRVIVSPLETAKNYIDIGFSLVGLAYDTYRAGKYTLERYMNTLELVRDALNNGLKVYGFHISEGWQVSRTVTIEGDNGVDVSATGDVSRSVTPVTYEYSGLRVVTVQGEDTLQRISQRELGNEALWPNIAAVNTGISSNDDLIPGDELFIPIQVEPTEGTNKEQFILTEDVARDPYGADIRLDANGNLVIQENSDLALISGIENIKQAIDLRLNTEVGSMIKQSVYGIVAQAGFAGTSTAIRYMKLSIRSAVIQDPRIESVSNMVVSIDGDTLSVSMDITVVGVENSLPVSLAL